MRQTRSWHTCHPSLSARAASQQVGRRCLAGGWLVAGWWQAAAARRPPRSCWAAFLVWGGCPASRAAQAAHRGPDSTPPSLCSLALLSLCSDHRGFGPCGVWLPPSAFQDGHVGGGWGRQHAGTGKGAAEARGAAALGAVHQGVLSRHACLLLVLPTFPPASRSGNCLDLSLDRLFAGPEAAAAAADGAAAGSGGRGAAGVVSLRGFTLEMLQVLLGEGKPGACACPLCCHRRKHTRLLSSPPACPSLAPGCPLPPATCLPAAQAASVLAGCDFAPSLKGISFRTAAGLVARRRSLDSVLRLLRAEKRWQLAATDEYCAAARRAALAFKHALGGWAQQRRRRDGCITYGPAAGTWGSTGAGRRLFAGSVLPLVNLRAAAGLALQCSAQTRLAAAAGA